MILFRHIGTLIGTLVVIHIFQRQEKSIIRCLFITRRVATLEDGLGDWPVSKPENATQGGILQVLVQIKEIPPHLRGGK